MSASTPLLTETVPATLHEWLAAGLPEAAPPFAFERIAGGYSMLTYRMTDRSVNAWVLRHPPAGNHGGRAHDPLREARAMSALWGTAVPVPRVRLTGSEHDPLGLPCHVTDFVDGYVVADESAARTCLSRESLRRASTDIAATLAALHTIDPDAVGLGDLGPRRDYLSRQLHRGRSMFSDATLAQTSGQVAALQRIATELERHLPPDTGGRIIHGDYRLGNAITGRDGAIRAILDWELVTLGDPLADVGMLAAYWDPPADAMLGERVPTSAPGAIGVEAALEHYATMTGADLSGLSFYWAMACWRIACLTVRTMARFQSGAMHDDSDTSKFLVACGVWIELAQEQLARREPS